MCRYGVEELDSDEEEDEDEDEEVLLESERWRE